MGQHSLGRLEDTTLSSPPSLSESHQEGMVTMHFGLLVLIIENGFLLSSERHDRVKTITRASLALSR